MQEQIRALRTLFETREDVGHSANKSFIFYRTWPKEHLRLLAERVERSDWDVKLEQIRQARCVPRRFHGQKGFWQALQESHKQRTLEAERLELLSKKRGPHWHTALVCSWKPCVSRVEDQEQVHEELQRASG